MGGNASPPRSGGLRGGRRPPRASNLIVLVLVLVVAVLFVVLVLVLVLAALVLVHVVVPVRVVAVVVVLVPVVVMVLVPAHPDPLCGWKMRDVGGQHLAVITRAGKVFGELPPMKTR